ncbi:MAG: peptide chain release factor 2 [Parcubacteria group bacterium]|nr:peptide chain release factor 2 [Parcubacteria group bacterium]
MAQLEKEMESPGFWKDKDSAAKKVKELSELKEKAKEIGGLEKRLKILKGLGESEEPSISSGQELEKELEKIEKRAGSLERQSRFSGPHDRGGAVLNIYSGAGGVDAQDWAMALFKMYQKFADRRGWSWKVLDQSFGEQRGIKSASLEISGPPAGGYAYGYLKNESGVHRLVRVSPFSAKGLRHTSFALVEVLPEMKEKEMKKIDPADLKIETFKSSGPGGQHMQKTESAVRITHKPTNLSVSVQSERSQSQNRQKAMQILESKLIQKMEEAKVKKISELKPVLSSGIEWGNQIRSYILNPYKMVKDHRTGAETNQADEVLEGNLDTFIEQ